MSTESLPIAVGVEDFAVRGRALQLHILGVRPKQWEGGHVWPPKTKMPRRRVRRIPDLLRDYAGALLITECKIETRYAKSQY
jgi:hypothetical protein